MLVLLCAGGCVSHMFGGGNGAAGPNGGPGDAALVSQWSGGAARAGGKMPAQGPAAAGFQQPSSLAPASEHMALMQQRLSNSDDDRKLLAARLQQMETQLQEKEKILVLSNYEVQEAARQVAQTREELKRWKTEMESLRTQLHNAEKENKGTLEAIIRTLEQFMEREKDTGKANFSGPALK